MGKKSRMSVLKRQREVRKQEKAAAKREKREQRHDEDESSSRVATADDLAGYGIGPQADDAEEEHGKDS